MYAPSVLMAMVAEWRAERVETSSDRSSGDSICNSCE